MLSDLLETIELTDEDRRFIAPYISNWTYLATFLADPFFNPTPEFFAKAIKLEIEGKCRQQMVDRLFTKYYTYVKEKDKRRLTDQWVKERTRSSSI